MNKTLTDGSTNYALLSEMHQHWSTATWWREWK